MAPEEQVLFSLGATRMVERGPASATLFSVGENENRPSVLMPVQSHKRKP